MREQSTAAVQCLRTRLRALEPGRVPHPKNGDIEKLLAEAWDDLDGDYGGMEPYKLLNRTEAMEWQPPILRFDIERHGRTVFGSVYAEIQEWTVNLDEGTVRVSIGRKRLVGKRQAPFKTAPIADELADAIANRTNDKRLRWSKTGAVQVRMKEVLPPGPEQTTEGRRKRLNRDLKERLAPLGWSHRASGWWSRPEDESAR